ncbi:energy transducer TonB [Prevotella sp. P5-92]
MSRVVNKDGSLTDFEITKSIDPSLDKGAIRVVKSMPKWNLGRRMGNL